jgi:hypothetical protein
MYEGLRQVAAGTALVSPASNVCDAGRVCNQNRPDARSDPSAGAARRNYLTRWSRAGVAV